MKPRLRFAPSPTGYLHIGGVRTALFNWLWARKTGGAFVLRIEDTDQARSTDESKQIIFDSMKWLGLDWDEGPGAGGAHGPYTQMERLALYKEHAEKLIASGHAFRCWCTKEELAEQREALKKKDPKAQFKYPGTCRTRTESLDETHVVRFKAPTEGSVTYVDKVFGEVVTPNVENQDFVLMRADGIPLYNFGAVVDDVTMGITLVARGRDHMINTPPQILIYEALGAKVPEFAHLPMMLAANGEKLSKRHGAVSVTEYRDKGYSPNAVLNYLARFGWSHGDQEVFSKEELVAAFSWESCGRGDGKFDDKKFLAIDHEHLKTERLTPNDEYADRVLPFLAANGLTPEKAAVVRALYTIRDRAKTFVEAADMLDFYFRAEPNLDDKAKAKFLVKDAAPKLRGLHAALASGEDWSEAALEERTNAFLAKDGLQIKDVAQPARVALTGRTASPGLFQVMHVLGRTSTLSRLERGAALSDA
ncbi:MAG: glutamate--tRNA ligase [Labilithrix sp.]|nr:glutamate--tRNA ligase [Labilithrix sp.]MCW5810133.1 glutamate--tRNA ligase [Labilithrix sp.]